MKVGVARGVAKRPRQLWIGVSHTRLPVVATPRPTTLMACGPDSQDQQFLRDLQGVAVWFLKKGDLYLDIKADTGTMRFYRGVAL